MRWFWIDKFLEFESGRYAVAVKNVSLAEDHLHEHFPGAPVMPSSLVVEGLAQTGGLLVGEYNQFRRRVVLAKVSSVRFYFQATPGDTLTYRTDIRDIKEHGAIVHGTSHVGERLQAETDIFFAHLPEGASGRALFDAHTFLNWLRILGMDQVGRRADGSKIELPPAPFQESYEYNPNPNPTGLAG